MKSIIKLDDVWKRYDMGKAGGLTVLKEISLDIMEKEFRQVLEHLSQGFGEKAK